jgi:hypothetical protein
MPVRNCFKVMRSIALLARMKLSPLRECKASILAQDVVSKFKHSSRASITVHLSDISVAATARTAIVINITAMAGMCVRKSIISLQRYGHANARRKHGNCEHVPTRQRSESRASRGVQKMMGYRKLNL